MPTGTSVVHYWADDSFVITKELVDGEAPLSVAVSGLFECGKPHDRLTRADVHEVCEKIIVYRQNHIIHTK